MKPQITQIGTDKEVKMMSGHKYPEGRQRSLSSLTSTTIKGVVYLCLAFTLLTGCPSQSIQRKVNAQTYFIRGATYLKQGSYDQAITEFSKAIAINPKLAVAYNGRGLAYRKQGKYDLAIANYNRTLELTPAEVEVYVDRGVAYRYKKEYDQTIEDCNKAIKINPDYIPAYITLGVTYYCKREYEQAIVNFTKAIKLNPNDPQTYLERADVYNSKGEFDQAIADYTKAIELDPAEMHNYFNRGLVCFWDKDAYDKAISDMSIVIKAKPTMSVLLEEAYLIRGQAYACKDEYEKAVADFKSILKINPNHRRAEEDLKETERALDIQRHRERVDPK